MIDFAALPPEINSARMYSGPGATPLMSASAAWAELSSTLSESAASIGSTVTGLAAVWMGPSSLAMTRAATNYAQWLMSTALSAEQSANQANAAVAAYETAFAATVPPPLIAANRTQLAALVATNILGINTAAIMATEALYAEMWAQDAAAMSAYSAESAAATTALPQFTPAPQTTTAVATPAATNTLAGIIQQILAALADPTTVAGQLNIYTQDLVQSGAFFDIPMQLLTMFNVLWAVSVPGSALSQAITNRINAGGSFVLPEITMPATPTPSISAATGVGERLGGRLSVPPSWAQQRETPTQDRGPVATPIGQSESRGLAGLAGMGGLGGLAGLRGTPTKQQRPEPQYGTASAVMPKHPYGG